MITQSIIDFFTFFPMLLMNAMDSFNFSLEIPQAFYNGFKDLLSCIGWIFPMTALLPIILFSFQLQIARIAWAIVLRIKSFIPTMGA